MSNITQYDGDGGDDGFQGGIRSGRVIKGMLIKWSETAGWLDRDGLKPPEVLLVFALDEVLQMWKAQKSPTRLPRNRCLTSKI